MYGRLKKSYKGHMAVGRPKRSQSTWDRCVADLAARGAQFRMKDRYQSNIIGIREIKDGKVVREFSSQVYKKTEDEDIETLYRLCIRASEAGTWEAVIGGTTTDEKMTWAEFANRVKANLVARVARESSRRDTQGHLKEHISKFRGEVTSKRLFKWACEEDPVTRFYPFRKRIETLAQIQASGLTKSRTFVLGGTSTKRNGQRL